MLLVSKQTTQFCLFTPLSPRRVRLSWAIQHTAAVGVIALPELSDLAQGRDSGNVLRIKEDTDPVTKGCLHFFFLFVLNNKNYSCRKAQAFRSRTAADTTFQCFASAVLSVTWLTKLAKSHFVKSYSNKTVCSSQQVAKKKSSLSYKVDF